MKIRLLDKRECGEVRLILGVEIIFLFVEAVNFRFISYLLHRKCNVVYDKCVVDKSGEKWRKTWITYL